MGNRCLKGSEIDVESVSEDQQSMRPATQTSGTGPAQPLIFSAAVDSSVAGFEGVDSGWRCRSVAQGDGQIA